MTFEVASSGRGGPPRGRGRGFGGDRGGGRGFSRGFRGGDTRGRGGGGRGRGDRGGRGSFRGGDRGAFRGDRGAFRGAPRGGNFNGSSAGGSSNGDRLPVCHETAHALQLRICYKSDISTDEEVSKQFPGFHSRFQKLTDKEDYFLLFKDIESLEAAKAKLEKDDAITTVDYMGLKSAKNQPLSLECRQLFLQLKSDQDEEAVKQLDESIVSVEFPKDKKSCYVEFATAEEANVYFQKAVLIKDHEYLAFCRESAAMKTNKHAKATTQPDQIVVRDVPKKATLKELALLFPDANSVTLYNKTFPSSEYCHASFRFEDVDRVKEILAQKKNNKILGKKIYITPAYNCLLADMPKLGETWTGDKVAEKSPIAANAKASKESPKKKIKLEKEANGDEEEDDDDEDDDEVEEGDEEDDDEEEEAEEENGKADNEEEMESEEDDDEDEESDD